MINHLAVSCVSYSILYSICFIQFVCHRLEGANSRIASLQQELTAKQDEAVSNRKAYQEVCLVVISFVTNSNFNMLTFQALKENEKVKERCSQLERSIVEKENGIVSLTHNILKYYFVHHL